MRGKATYADRAQMSHGITPAYAGKRWPSESPCPPCRDHPRVCGEKSPICLDSLPLVGSPPRMRGKAVIPVPEVQKGGITPAYAGKSSAPPSRKPSNGDHPRVCGKKANVVDAAGICTGSPPRVRGKDVIKAADGSTIGITPACAGKSTICDAFELMQRDHPRVCGEKSKKIP